MTETMTHDYGADVCEAAPIPGTTPRLAGALAVFQANMPVIPKSLTGQSGNRTFKYADIAVITKTCAPLLAAQGLSVTNSRRIIDGRTILTATLMHSSGESISSETDITAPAGDMKTSGSNSTYARRYMYGELTGVVTEEDADSAGTNVPEGPAELATPDQIEQISRIADQRGNDFAKFMWSVIGRRAVADDITPDEAAKLIKADTNG